MAPRIAAAGFEGGREMNRRRIIMACIIWIHAIAAGILVHHRMHDIALPVTICAILLFLTSPLFTESDQ